MVKPETHRDDQLSKWKCKYKQCHTPEEIVEIDKIYGHHVWHFGEDGEDGEDGGGGRFAFFASSGSWL